MGNKKNDLKDLFKFMGKQPPQSKKDAPKRVQFNTQIDPAIITDVKALAARFGTRSWVIAEHVLQIGCYYLAKAYQDQDRRERLQKHLIDTHYLRPLPYDDEKILRLGESTYSPHLIELAQTVVKHTSDMGKVMKAVRAGKTTIGTLERCRDAAIEAALILADWVVNHPLDASPATPTATQQINQRMRPYWETAIRKKP